MDGANIEGDYTIRELDIDTPASALHVWHTHFDTPAAQADINVVYPIDRLKELVARASSAEWRRRCQLHGLQQRLSHARRGCARRGSGGGPYWTGWPSKEKPYGFPHSWQEL